MKIVQRLSGREMGISMKENLHAKGVVKELPRKVSHDTRVENKGGQAKPRPWNNTRRPVTFKARVVNR